MDGLLISLNAVISPTLLAAAFGGVLWGIIGGALPGISASISMALLLPFTYGMDPTTGIVLLAATYVGAEYGGSIPAILINTPGTNAAAATVLDGYAMNQKGLGGEALGISLACGVIGGLFGLVLLVGLTEPLAQIRTAIAADPDRLADRKALVDRDGLGGGLEEVVELLGVRQRARARQPRAFHPNHRRSAGSRHAVQCRRA